MKPDSKIDKEHDRLPKDYVNPDPKHDKDPGPSCDPKHDIDPKDPKRPLDDR